MSSVRLAFSSSGACPLSSMAEGARGVIVEVHAHDQGRADRLLSLGVTPGASVMMLQTFPGVVFLCDQTELAVERGVANAILVRLQETRP
jgi:Fe2+ transport system protein FeoA